MNHDDRFAALSGLSDWQLENEDQDIRSYPVRSLAGDEYGKVDDMLVDKENERVIAIRMDDGRLIAVEHLDIMDDHVIYRDDQAASGVDYARVRSRTI